MKFAFFKIAEIDVDIYQLLVTFPDFALGLCLWTCALAKALARCLCCQQPCYSLVYVLICFIVSVMWWMYSGNLSAFLRA
jgi:hypothetical protein